MSRNYKFHNPDGAYFISFAVVEWLDVFTRNEYKDIVLDSLAYCQDNNKVIFEKINYIHNNPVEEGLVYNPEDYVYSSARDYSGEKGILDNIVVVD
ncbi:MAG: hypothetical protein B6I18_05185 [Bacteroidetes bacterium 4572_112]|nr:MAG: hypothetical protein B6I18_05185 [Bacteroidetes bacterium 4572_112]